MADYHWSMILFGTLYTLFVVGAIICRFCCDTPLPREVAMGIIALFLVLGLVRFTSCMCGTLDCPMTIGGMKATCTLMLASIILITILSFDLPLANMKRVTA